MITMMNLDYNSLPSLKSLVNIILTNQSLYTDRMIKDHYH